MQELKEITASFINAVKAGRKEAGATLGEGIFTGKTFNNEKSQELGLIDATGSLMSALEVLSDMAGDYRKKRKNNTNNNTDMKILEVLGLGKEVESKLTAEQKEKLEAADAKLAEIEASQAENVGELEANIAALKADNDTLNAEKQELQEAVSEKDAKITELQAQLEKAPAGNATTVTGNSDKGHEYERKDEEFGNTSVDKQLAELRKLQGL